MEQNTVCEIVQDLIPLCAAERAGKASVRLVADHMKECEACRARYEAQRSGFRRHMGKMCPAPRDPSMRYFKWTLAVLDVLAVMLCAAVNYSVEGRLSWALIVAGALASTGLPMLVYIRAYTNRFIKAMFFFSVLALGLLGLIQIVVFDIMQLGGVWIWRVAAPVTAVWLAAVWTAILVSKRCGLNGFYCIAMLLFLCVPAEIATSAIAAAYTREAFLVRGMAMAGYGVAAAAFGVVGALFDQRHRRKNGG